MKVVAEGVETEAQLAELRRLDCDSAQGYLLASPMDFTALTKFFGVRIPVSVPAMHPELPSAAGQLT
jgi:EAL domain-containing protein (putative c-di-GMP-specific phosphodiesterase class I)